MNHLTKILIISNLISVCTVLYLVYPYQDKQSIYKYKCPESSTHIQASHINTVTKEVSCTYYPPTRKSTTGSIK